MRNLIAKRQRALAPLGALLMLAVTALLSAKGAHLIEDAVSSGSNAAAAKDQNVGPIFTAVNNLTKPALYLMVAVVPMAGIVGAFALLVGSRRGLVICGSTVGALILVATIGGIAK
jgi:hypothetical protein